jgi:hypothetical protein
MGYTSKLHGRGETLNGTGNRVEAGCLRLTTNAERPRMLKRRKVLQAPKNDADSGLADCVWEQISGQRVQEPRRAQQTTPVFQRATGSNDAGHLAWRSERPAAYRVSQQPCPPRVELSRA